VGVPVQAQLINRADDRGGLQQRILADDQPTAQSGAGSVAGTSMGLEFALGLAVVVFWLGLLAAGGYGLVRLAALLFSLAFH
jgi:hypothetical protein